MTTLILAALTVLLTAACGPKPPAALDVTPYQNRVCDLLDFDQLGGFHIFWPGIPGDDPARPSCLWEAGDTRILVTLDLDPAVRAPVTQGTRMINGFPASHGAFPGKGAQSACATTIDTRRRQTFTATLIPRKVPAAPRTPSPAWSSTPSEPPADAILVISRTRADALRYRA